MEASSGCVMIVFYAMKKVVPMARQKKDAKILNIRLATPVSDKLEVFCKESGQTKTVAVERFLTKCLDEYFALPKKRRFIN